MSSYDLDACFKFAEDVAKKAGVIIEDGFYKVKNIEEKESSRDLVTEYDKAVEEMFIKELENTFPDHKYIGEESVAAGVKCELTDAPTWIVDPIDGTMNFVHSFPSCCFSIGLCLDKVPVIGLIYNPILKQTYTARKGQGAFFNGKQIKVSGQKNLSHSLVMTELWCRPSEEKMKIAYENAMNVISRSHGPRSMGSAALNMCFVAQGSVDAYFEIGIHAWDMAAGRIIVEEAGGVVTDMTGAPHDLLNRRVLCASSVELAKELSSILKVYDETRD